MIEPLNIPYEDFWCLKKQKGFSKYHTRAYSQHYQDGIIERIFEVIGTTNKVCVEFGAKNGLDMSNTANLRIAHGWKTILFEPFCSPNSEIGLYKETVTPENVNLLFDKYGVSQNLGFLSIDVDGHDYWIWKALTYQPRVVQIESNVRFKPTESRVYRYKEGEEYPQGTDGGASVLALKKLGESKGYSLVYRQRHDLFFVKTELLNKKDVNIPLEKIYSDAYESWYGPEESRFIDV